MPIHMDHIVLNVNDDDKMMLLYTEVMKFTPERLQEYRSRKVPFPSVRINDDTIIDLFPKALWKRGRNDDDPPPAGAGGFLDHNVNCS